MQHQEGEEEKDGKEKDEEGETGRGWEKAPGVLHVLLALGDTAARSRTRVTTSSVPSPSLARVRVTFTGDTTGSAASLGKSLVSRNRSSFEPYISPE